ncbi:MAG: PepSY domain-containing protein [Oscillochloridaceae bacterium umkhey_bin13]
MPQRTLLMTAAALTVFILMMAVAMITQVTQTTVTATDPTSIAGAATGQSDPTALSAELQQREAAYQAALAEANQRIADANTQLAAQAAATSSATPASANPAMQVTSPPTADEAAAIATQYRNGGTVRKVELEEERGLMVYEVKFTDGGEVYVDATTGQVVYAKLADTEQEDDD